MGKTWRHSKQDNEDYYEAVRRVRKPTPPPGKFHRDKRREELERAARKEAEDEARRNQDRASCATDEAQ